MHDKNYDDFFDEQKTRDSGERELLKLIDKYETSNIEAVQKGSKVAGTVARIGSDYAFINVGGKTEAMMKLAEFGGNPPLAGDRVEGYIVSDTGGEVMISSSLEGFSASTGDMIDAMRSRIPVQGKVTGVSKGGLNVRIMGKRGFCPISQIDIKYVADVNAFFGQTMTFVIERVTEGGRNIVLSRIPLLEQELERQLDELAEDIANRHVHRGKITRITPFGVFVEIGAAEGLVHISEVSWDRSENLDQLFQVGQEVECVVLKVEKKSPLRESKISLSLRQVLADPWATAPQDFKAGTLVDGEVTRLAGFGAFVRLAPGIEGLIHISEMSWTKRVHHPNEVVGPGSRVRVTVLEVKPEKKEISLSLKDVDADPWRDITGRFPSGSFVTGRVSGKTKYGYFVDLSEGVTGLLVFSNIASDKKESLKPGDEVEVCIENVDAEKRRIGLSHGIRDRAAVMIPEQMASARERWAEEKASDFGAALRAALERKKGG